MRIDTGSVITVRDIARHPGNDPCAYGCGADADFDVTLRGHIRVETYPACLDCCRANSIYPYQNGWFDQPDLLADGGDR